VNVPTVSMRFFPQAGQGLYGDSGSSGTGTGRTTTPKAVDSMFEKTLRWRIVLIFEEMEVIKDLFGIQFYGTTVKMEGSRCIGRPDSDCSWSGWIRFYPMGLQLKWKAPDASGGQTATVVGQGGFAFAHQRHRPLHFLMNFTKARNRFASFLDDATTFFS